jgi:hypothetical protein
MSFLLDFPTPMYVIPSLPITIYTRILRQWRIQHDLLVMLIQLGDQEI